MKGGAESERILIMLLLISGHPGAGKTHFCEWLKAEKSYVHVDVDVSSQLGNLDVQDSAQARQVLDAAVSISRDVAVEWGYPPELLPSVRLLKSAGFEPWWFDADEPTARLLWQERRPGADLAIYRSQLDRIAAAWPALAEFYSDHVIRTVNPGPSLAACPDLAARILG